jgi:predicted transcriptional regulator
MEEVSKNEHNAQVVAIAVAYLGNPNVRIEKNELAEVIRQIDSALRGPVEPAQSAEPKLEMPSAQAIRVSITPDHLISFIDARPYKSLRRHLGLHGHTPKSYRERYGLKSDYPMTAPNYSAQRSELAKKMGLGQIGAQSRAAARVEKQPTPAIAASAEPVNAAPSKRRASKAAAVVATSSEVPPVSSEPVAIADVLPRRRAAKTARGKTMPSATTGALEKGAQVLQNAAESAPDNANATVPVASETEATSDTPVMGARPKRPRATKVGKVAKVAKRRAKRV